MSSAKSGEDFARARAMASNAVRVSQLIELPPALTWQESIALVRSLAAIRGSSPGVSASGTYDEFALEENGEVTGVGSVPPLSVTELALLLARLLPATPRSAASQVEATARSERPPAGLYFTIARALALVDAPSFAGAHDFAATLARFEQARPAVVLRRTFQRCAVPARPESIADQRSDARGAASATVRIGLSGEGETAAQRVENAGSTGLGRPDRRRSRMPSDVLRRMLREEDRRNFLELQARTNHAIEAKRRRQTGPDPQMLRRFIREADERTFALIQEKAARAGRPFPAPRRAGYHAAFALLALLVAVAVFTLLGWQRLPRQSADGDNAPGRRTTTAGPQPTMMTAAVPAVTTAVAAAAPTTEAQATATQASAPREGPRRQGPGGHGPTAQAPADKTATRIASTSAPKKPAKRAAVGGASATPDRYVAKRRGPVPRFFAALYRRLGSLVHRDSGQPAMTE